MKRKNANGIGRIPAVLCMLCILLFLSSATLTVNAESNAKLTAAFARAERGDTVAVAFALEDNPGIWGLKLKVSYDHSALTLASVTNGNIFEENDIVLPDSLAREQFVFVAASDKLEDTAAGGILVTLNFLVESVAADQTYPVKVEVIQAVNLAGEDVNIEIENGSITVEETEDSAEPTQKPAEPTQRPAEPTQKPAEPTQKPAEPTQKPAEPTQKPAEPTENPGESEPEVMPVSAQPGDDNNSAIWVALVLVILFGAGTYCAMRIRKGRRS